MHAVRLTKRIFDTRNSIVPVLPSPQFDAFEILFKHGFYQDLSIKMNFTLLKVY
jgi:hypothetical protein